MLNDGRIDTTVTPATLRALLDSGRVRCPLAAADLAFLQRFGVLRPEVVMHEGRLQLGEHSCGADLRDDVDVTVLTSFLELVLEGLVSHLAMGLPADDMEPVLDLVEETVRRHRRSS